MSRALPKAVPASRSVLAWARLPVQAPILPPAQAPVHVLEPEPKPEAVQELVLVLA